jgi:hypothetical protein
MVLSIGVRVIVDANEQVDRLGLWVVEGYRKRFYTRPISRLSCWPYGQLGPVRRFEIDLRGGPAGIDASPGDQGKVGPSLCHSHRIGRITKMDDRLYHEP